MANPFRNEVDVTLGDKTFRLRATFNFIAEIEEMFDTSMYNLVTSRAVAGKLRASELKAVMVAGVRAAGDRPNEAEIEESIIAAGLIKATAEVIPFLARTFEGAPVEEKK